MEQNENIQFQSSNSSGGPGLGIAIKKKNRMKGFSIAGVICGIIAIIPGVILIILAGNCIGSAGISSELFDALN